jgi:DNA polymerase
LRRVDFEGDFDTWRAVARGLLEEGVSPGMVAWNDADDPQGMLFGAGATAVSPRDASSFRVPREFVKWAKDVSYHRDPRRWSLLYRVLWRLTHGEPNLLSLAADDDVRRMKEMEQSVRRDAHKMKAFVRFRKVDDDGREHFIAWHRPDHLIVPRVAPFFQDRFSTIEWTILTPDASVSWDGEELRFGPGTSRDAAPDHDQLEELWKSYYGSIFNPARVKIAAMCAEMPRKHWATLPEAEIIRELLLDAPRRVAAMVDQTPDDATAFVPNEPHSLDEISRAMHDCRACGLCGRATGPVPGEGPEGARLVLVGEQPGDQEDLAGRPFVGPAGEVLDRALAAAGVPREEVYITNALKAFKYEPMGDRRLHKRPDAYEVEICRPWLDAELVQVRPSTVVALGTTPAQTLLGRRVRIEQVRRQVHHGRGAWDTMVTYHPSAVLRRPDPAAADRIFEALVADLADAWARA